MFSLQYIASRHEETCECCQVVAQESTRGETGAQVSSHHPTTTTPPRVSKPSSSNFDEAFCNICSRDMMSHRFSGGKDIEKKRKKISNATDLILNASRVGNKK